MNEEQDLENFSFWVTILNPEFTGLSVNVYATAVAIGDTPILFVPTRYGKEFDWRPFTITITKDPQVFGFTGDITYLHVDEIREFIICNRKVLLEHWNGSSSLDIIRSVRSVYNSSIFKLCGKFTDEPLNNFPKKLCETTLCFFSEISVAEHYLDDLVKAEDLITPSTFLFFELEEIILNQPVWTKQYSIYDHSGEYNGFHEIETKYLWGRSPEECQFHEGDVILFGNALLLNVGIIVKNPPSYDEAKEISAQLKNEGVEKFDYSLDSYKVLTCEGNIYEVPVFFAFEAKGVDDRIIKDLKMGYKSYQKKCI